MKIIITGGHITPALAVIDELLEKQKDASVIVIGRQFANERENNDTYEYQEVTARKVPFYHVNAIRFTRTISLETFKLPITILKGIRESMVILKKEKPDCLLSFGGYIGLSVAYAAFFLRIPVFTHEQTMHPGLANRLIGFIATNIFVAFPLTKEFFCEQCVEITGNPIRKHIFESKGTLQLPDSKGSRPHVLVMGGSLGSHAINNHIENIIEKLLVDLAVVHQTGNIAEFNDFERLQNKRNSMPDLLKINYKVVSHISSQDIGQAYAWADIVVSRSGANTVFELLALQKPAIYIPLPISAHHEQELQAEYAALHNVASIFWQDESSEKLYHNIHTMITGVNSYKQAFKKFPDSSSINAAEHIISTIYSKVQKGTVPKR